jgi:hypothetical protein
VKYRDFRLEIVAGPGASYTVYAQSPRGEGRSSFIPPLQPKEETGLRAVIWQSVRDLALKGRTELDRPYTALGKFGEQLFTALFSGEILTLYERSLDLLEADPEVGLRLKLVFNDSSLAFLQRFPWELLRQPGRPDWLALSRRQPIVRYIPVTMPVHKAFLPTVLRIVAVAARPHRGGLSPLKLDQELLDLREAMEPVPGLELVIPASPTLVALRQTLLDRKCHVLHFMGHGGVVAGQNERVLFFESEDGNVDPVCGTDLINKLSDCTTLRLAVLNACGSATVPATGMDFDPFAGVASSLVLGGLPAVIAMQFPISDQAAIVFSRAFYQRLAAGDPVDAAVTEGRQAVHSADRTSFEWATPVLFMRPPDGVLYSTNPPPPPPPPPPLRWAVLLLIVAVALGLFDLIHSGPKALRGSQAASLPARPIEVTLYDAGPATLLSDQDSIAVHFNKIKQERFVTVSVNNELQAALISGTQIAFRRYSVYILEINYANRSVRLRVVRNGNVN